MIKSLLRQAIIILFTIALVGCTNPINNSRPQPSVNPQKVTIKDLPLNNGDDENNETSEKKLPSPNEPSLDNSLALQIDYGDGKIITNYKLRITNYEKQYLWAVMKKTLEANNIYFDYQDYGADLGVFIKQIGDKKNGQENKYWQYFINGQYAPVGASNYLLQPGDIILWKFTNEN